MAIVRSQFRDFQISQYCCSCAKDKILQLPSSTCNLGQTCNADMTYASTNLAINRTSKMSKNVLAFADKKAETPLKTTRFRQMLTSPDTSFIMEAHNGLSAKIVEETGFEGVWASGLSVSSALGVRDSNEASWTQVLEVLEFMADATSIPILVDADTGYGNFNNFRRLVNKLIQRDIAAVCIEDKLFPKIWQGNRLVPIVNRKLMLIAY